MWGTKTVSKNEMAGEKKESGRKGYILGQMNRSVSHEPIHRRGKTIVVVGVSEEVCLDLGHPDN